MVNILLLQRYSVAYIYAVEGILDLYLLHLKKKHYVYVQIQLLYLLAHFGEVMINVVITSYYGIRVL